MSDNLIFYINKLSNLIVAEELESDKNVQPKVRSDRFYDRCVKNVRQKGCDVLLNKTSGTHIEDPCVTDYGGHWSPVTLITDYGGELKAQGAGKYNDMLLSWISTLQEKEYDCVEDLLKFLLLLKKPLEKKPQTNFQSDLSLNTSNFLINGMDSLSFLSEEFSCDSLSKTSSFRKGIQYEESWTKHFDSKFQVLGEFSKRNILSVDKVSLKSILSSKEMMVSSQSHTNSFAFTDFSSTRNYKSEKSLFDIDSNTYQNDNTLLDSFVDHPISHKLPSLNLNMKFSCKSGFLRRSHSQPPCSGGEDQTSKSSSMDVDSIPCRKSGSYNLTDLEFKKEKCSSSKEIILGLWEQEQSLIREFRPELTPSLPSLRMISKATFIEDVKYLLTGINSDSFKYDSDRNRFSIVYGTCLDDVTPESLYHFSKEFIEIGNNYVKLISCVYETGRNSFDTCTTISQAFWKSIFDYLELHYSLVLEIPPSTNLMALKSCTRELHEIITTVARICKVNCKRSDLPQGGELLSYLLKVAEELSRQSVTNIVFGILQNCCNVYYMCTLQNWMFKGRLDSQNNEFFVDYRRQKCKIKSRTYYSSFFLIDEKVPSFLRGYEESFYNCGKSIHFLKLFNAEDTLCQFLEKGYHPTMRLCFSDDQITKLEDEFKAYEDRVLKICGERITIKTLRNEEKEKEKNYQNYIKEFKALQEKEKKEARLKQLEEIKTRKEEQNKLLNEQRHSIEAEKERKKRAAKEEELRLEEEIKRETEARENLLNEEKTKLKKHYGDKMEALNREIIVSEARKEALKRLIESEIADANSNEILTDHEGNITNNLDSNASSSNSENNSVTSCTYDENSNPCLKADTNGNREEEDEEAELEVRKSMSFRTTAAEEAARNKCKVLRSEFGLPVRNEPVPAVKRQESKPIESMTDLERNRQRVLQSEYNFLLKQTPTHISLTSIPQAIGIVKERIKVTPPETVSEKDEEVSEIYTAVELERKSECIDLKKPPEKIDPVDVPSSDSNELSVENVSSTSFELRTGSEGFVGLSDKYQDALKRDSDIFLKKSSQHFVFCSLKEEEIDNLPCTDFLKFQRFLRKSAIIPLKVQEKLANDALLKHILRAENLLSHLRSLRGYFFLNDGEFGRSFTQQIFRSLCKCTEPTQFFERSNLSNIVNEALNYTIHSYDPNAQNLSFRILNMPPFLNHSSHDVLSPFELSYKVDWPLNFILTEKALNKYKMVFRFLLKLKRINWTLNENFLYLNLQFKNRRLNGNVHVDSPHYHKIQIFRHAMTQVMITLDDYIFSNGIQFPWIYFLKDLETTQNIDHLYQKHVRYIKDVLSRCFLSKDSEDLLDCINNLIELALKFHYTCKSSAMEVVKGRYEHPKFTVLKATFNEFCCVIKTFLKTLKEKLSSNEVLRSHYVLIEKFDLKLT